MEWMVLIVSLVLLPTHGSSACASPQDTVQYLGTCTHGPLARQFKRLEATETAGPTGSRYKRQGTSRSPETPVTV